MNINCPFCDYKFSNNENIYSGSCIAHRCKDFIISLKIDKDKINYLGVLNLSDKSIVTIINGQAIIDKRRNHFLGNDLKDFEELVKKAINFKENLIFL